MIDDKKTTVAILYIGIGVYIDLWKGFYESFEKRFLPNSRKDYFLFTDHNCDTVLYGDQSNVHIIYQENMGWPGNTLRRFEVFLAIEDQLKEYDYIFFMNANMYCARKIEENEILPQDGEIVVVDHPWHYDDDPRTYIYERNPRSTAYVSMGEGEHYVCGGVNGGRAETYLKMIRYLNEKVQEDLKNDIIALWHDESHLNRYIIDFPKYRALPPSFCYHEPAPVMLRRAIVARNKRAYFNQEDIKPIHLSGAEINGRMLNQNRLEIMNKTLKSWIKCMQGGNNVAGYLREKGIETVIIYGYQNLGELLIWELQDRGIQIQCVVDKNAKQIEDKAIAAYEKIPENISADLIIVTAVHAFCQIQEQLDAYTDIPVVALDDLLCMIIERM